MRRARPMSAIKDRDIDYFCVGPVYAASTKPDYDSRPRPGPLCRREGAGRCRQVQALVCHWRDLLDNLDAVIEAGARRVCVVRAITEAS